MVQNKANQGTIDLHGLFEAAAQRLILSVTQGKLLHKTKNIRDAGVPFEAEFRTFLGSRLPAPFSVKSGYLFDPKSNCTPQIDAIVVDGQESHELMRSDEGAAYIPYPSGYTICEVKNSSQNLSSHIKQIMSVSRAIDTMRSDAKPLRHGGGPSLERPLTILLIGDSSAATLNSFKKAYKAQFQDPGFTLLLDRGLIIAKRTGLEDTFVTNGRNGKDKPFSLNPYAYRSAGLWGVWKPEAPDGKSGWALLWLYFAIMAQLNLSARGNQGAILDFTNQVARDFPMVLVSDLSAMKSW